MVNNNLKFEKTDYMVNATVEYIHNGEHVIRSDSYPIPEKDYNEYQEWIENEECIADNTVLFEEDILNLFFDYSTYDFGNDYCCIDAEDPNLSDKLTDEYEGREYVGDDVHTRNEDGWICHDFYQNDENRYVRHYLVMIQIDEDDMVVKIGDISATAAISKSESIVVVPNYYDLDFELSDICR